MFFDQTLEHFFWPLDNPEELARWIRSQELVPLEGDDEGGLVTSNGKLVRLHRQVVLEADEIDRIVVKLERDDATTRVDRFSIFWAPNEEAFTGSRRIRIREDLAWENDELTLDLRVGDHPEWKERIVRIGLGLLLPEGQRVRITHVAGYSEDPLSRRLPISVVDRVQFEYQLKEPEEHNRWGRVVKNVAGSSSRSVMIRRPFHRQAEEIDVIEVVLRGLAPSSRPHVVLAWSGADEIAGAPRILRQRDGMKLGRNRRTYRFDLRDHSLWRGKLNRLRISFFEQPDENITLESVTGLTIETDGTSLERALAEGCKVQLGYEVRNALPALPGLPVERQMVVPKDGLLRFSYGTLGRVPLPISFKATATREGREPAVLFTANLTREDEQNRWHEAAVELGRFSGDEISVVLETDSPVPPDPALGLPYWGNPELLGYRRRAAPPNVILISVDTLRADRLSLYGYQRPTSPNLDRWAEASAVVFENAVAQAPWTLPSHLSMLSGLNAYRFPGSDARGRSGRPMLARRLREAGYATLGVTGGGYLHPAFGFTDGFDRFRFFPGRDEHEEGEFRTGVDRALEWMTENRERPFFLFLHTYEVHEPFRARQPWFSEFSALPPPLEPVNMSVPRRNQDGGYQKSKPMGASDGDESPELVGDLYDSGIAYADEQLARVFEFLAAEQLDQRTLVVLTSDHGELLGEHGLGGHLYLWDENLMVPLVIARPGGVDGGTRVRQQVRLVDIVPTILDLTGLAETPDTEATASLDGVSLAPLMAGEPGEVPPEAWSYAAFSNFGLGLRIRNARKYVYNNTVWSPIRASEEFFEITPAGERLVDLTEAPELERLRREAQRVLAEEATGVRVRFENLTDKPFEGLLRGHLIHQGSLKSVDLPCDCVRWKRSREISLEVPPGVSYTLIIENLSGNWIDLELEGFGTTLLLDELRETRSVVLTNDGWKLQRPSGATDVPEPLDEGARVSLWRVGDFATEAAAGESDDPALQDRLRALGYIN